MYHLHLDMLLYEWIKLIFVFRDILGRKSNRYPKVKRKVMILKCEREMFLLTSVKITPFVRQVNKTFCTWPLIQRTQQASVTAKLWEFVVTIFDLSVHVSQDEECLRPGDASDLTFLEKLEDTVGGHPHFVTLVWYSLFSSTAYTVWSHIKFSLSDFELLNVSSLFPGKSTLFVCVLSLQSQTGRCKDPEGNGPWWIQTAALRWGG